MAEAEACVEREHPDEPDAPHGADDEGRAGRVWREKSLPVDDLHPRVSVDRGGEGVGLTSKYVNAHPAMRTTASPTNTGPILLTNRSLHRSNRLKLLKTQREQVARIRGAMVAGARARAARPESRSGRVEGL